MNSSITIYPDTSFTLKQRERVLKTSKLKLSQHLIFPLSSSPSWPASFALTEIPECPSARSKRNSGRFSNSPYSPTDGFRKASPHSVPWTPTVRSPEAITSWPAFARNAVADLLGLILVVSIKVAVPSSTKQSGPCFVSIASPMTLQELLAPKRMKFYGGDWRQLTDMDNDKEHEDFMDSVSRITNIPIHDLCHFEPGTNRICEGMSWASKRITTRTEDIAYSLIGIFDVNLPIAYGKSTWAFHRLMEAIIHRCDEWGIFTWAGSPSTHHSRTSAIPQSPACYHLIDVGGSDDIIAEGYKWAIGILNYRAVEPKGGYGKLEGEKSYVSYLLHRRMVEEPRTREHTDNILIVNTLFESESRDPLLGLWL